MSKPFCRGWASNRKVNSTQGSLFLAYRNIPQPEDPSSFFLLPKSRHSFVRLACDASIARVILGV